MIYRLFCLPLRLHWSADALVWGLKADKIDRKLLGHASAPITLNGTTRIVSRPRSSFSEIGCGAVPPVPYLSDRLHKLIFIIMLISDIHFTFTCNHRKSIAYIVTPRLCSSANALHNRFKIQTMGCHILLDSTWTLSSTSFDCCSCTVNETLPDNIV